jgi:cytochrome c553
MNVLKIVAVCAACHGDKGISENALYPNLAGQKKEYLVKQLKDFKSGNRKDPVMTAQALTLSDSDIEEISAYFSKMKAK